MHNFKKLSIWIKSADFVTEIYKVTNSFPSNERYGLVSQLQRAAVSVPANISEGSAKSSNKDFARFLEISLGSTFELETELLVSLNLSYVNNLFLKVVWNSSRKTGLVSYIDLEKHNQLQEKLASCKKITIGFK